MKHSLRTFKQMPTPASRRVWEGKARHYNSKNVKRAIFAAAQKIGAAARKKTWNPLARGAILYKNTV
jgi:hypothetical protein